MLAIFGARPVRFAEEESMRDEERHTLLVLLDLAIALTVSALFVDVLRAAEGLL